jgi:hypothetical protein
VARAASSGPPGDYAERGGERPERSRPARRDAAFATGVGDAGTETVDARTTTPEVARSTEAQVTQAGHSWEAGWAESLAEADGVEDGTFAAGSG